MISQPDKLFRDKLENFQHPAPVGAWNKIEHNLAKPTHKIVWLRVAAGMALLLAAGIWLWPTEKTEIHVAETNTQTLSPEKEIAKQPAVLNHSDKVKKNELTSSHKKTNLITKAKEVTPQPVQVNDDSAQVVIVPEQKELIASVNISEKEMRSKTIVYTQDEVNAKFLKKKLTQEATPELEEASGIQKLIGLAYAAKNADATLGDLREKKDNLFALNFSKKQGEN